MREDVRQIGCILMASGLSARYGRNKLLEKLDGRELILHTAGCLTEAGLEPLAVTRSREVKALMDREGIACVLHGGPLKSDTMHEGIRNLAPDCAGYLFMPADQPLIRPASLRRMTALFFRNPDKAVRLCFGDTPGSPVLFPARCRDDLLAYTGDRGGMDVIRGKGIPWDPVQAAHVWELWDADTPEKMEQIRTVYDRLVSCNTAGEEKEGRTDPGRCTGTDAEAGQEGR